MWADLAFGPRTEHGHREAKESDDDQDYRNQNHTHLATRAQ